MADCEGIIPLKQTDIAFHYWHAEKNTTLTVSYWLLVSSFSAALIAQPTISVFGITAE